MKTYKIPELRRIAKDQGYTLAALDDVNGNRIVTANSGSKKISIDKHLGTIENRLKAEVIPDGIYSVVMAQNIQGLRAPDRYAITKGKVNPEEISEAPRSGKTLVVQSKADNVLSYDKALEMQNTIATLTAENKRLTDELKDLTEYCDDLEKKGGGVSENGTPATNGIDWKALAETFKETVSAAIPMVDRHFNLQEKKLDLELFKLQRNGNGAAGNKTGKSRVVEITPGSQEHLDVIETLFKKEGPDGERLNAELDLLEQVNEELYLDVCKKLGIEMEESEE